MERALDGGEDLGAVVRLLDECYAAYDDYDTMYSLANIRACQDSKNAFYAEEYAWCSEHYAQVRQIMEELLYACGGSDLAGELEQAYFWEGFAQDYGEENGGSLSDRAVELMERESALLAQYRALSASPSITLNGREWAYDDCLAELSGQALEEAMSLYYNKYNGPLAGIYLQLVEVRQALALELGYDSYEQMQYDYTFERDYSPEDAAAYVEDIRTYMVPFYREVMARNPYGRVFYDWLPEERLCELLGAAAESIGGEVEEVFAFMTKYGLYDVRPSADKAPMSFQIYLTDYEAPFAFLDAYGDTEDLLSFAHEFGHCVDAYVNRDAYETIDVSECFSQGMEYLVLSRFDELLDREEADNLRLMQMLDTVENYVQQASFAEFEREVYAADPAELDAETLNELSLRLAIDYGYYDGVSEEYYAMSWIDIVHFFEMPFYVITYPVSNDAALQLYELEQREPGLGVEKYLELLPREHEGLIDTLTACGLESPFAPGRIRQAVELLRPQLLGAA